MQDVGQEQLHGVNFINGDCEELPFKEKIIHKRYDGKYNYEVDD